MSAVDRATTDWLRDIGFEPPADIESGADQMLRMFEEHVARCTDRLAKVARHAGRIKGILEHSRDTCPEITEMRAEVDDLLAALGARE